MEWVEMEMVNPPKWELVLRNKKNQYGEYQIKIWHRGHRNPDGDYYTPDWDDAVATFKRIADDLKVDWYATQKLNLYTGKWDKNITYKTRERKPQ